MAAVIKYFDTHEFVKRSKELGVSQDFAEYQVKQIEKAIETAISTIKEDIKNQDLATKSDILLVKKAFFEAELRLKGEIARASNKIIIWVVALLIASGLIQHFFK